MKLPIFALLAGVILGLLSPAAHAATAAVVAGKIVTLSNTVDGTAPFTYQWFKDSAILNGANSATYSISSFQATNAGVYYAVVSNSAGSTTSDGATLTYVFPPVFVTQPASQTVTAGSPVTFTAAASGSPAPTYQWLRNGVNLTGATSTAYTIASVAAGDAGTYSVVASNSSGSATSNGALLTVTTPLVFFTTQPASQTVTADTPVTFTAAASGLPAPTYQWRKNGVNLTGATGTSYTIMRVAVGDAGTYSVVASNSSASATSNGAVLTVTTAPNFTTQPASQTATAGSPVTFTAAAGGSPAPTYQWLKNGVNLTGATSTAYTIASVAAGDAGTYSVVASNSFGSATSNGAVLTVSTPPVFTTQPASQTMTAGSLVTFTVAASGSPAPTYQWRKNGVNLTGATSTAYTIASVAAGDAGTYSVVASNSFGSATSNGALLTVSTPPVFTTQPASQTVTAGTAVTFTVAASGSPAPTYQWRKNGVNLTGATGTSYTIASVAAGDAGTYSVVASNSFGSATSNGALLTVSTPPVFTTQPASQTVTAGTAVTFTVAASGSPAPTYQWRKNGLNLTGATGTSYTIASVAAGDAGTYSVVASNSTGSATSNGALLTVSTPPVFTTQPASQTVTVGTPVTFTAAASGSPAPTYQWLKNGVNLTGATGTSYTIASVAAGDAGTYSVAASNSSGSATSNGALLTVTTAPIFTTQPASQTVTAGTPVTFTATASGSPAPTYQWLKNGVNLTGATGTSYTIASVAVGDAGTYSVVASNSSGSATSNGALLTVSTAPIFTTQPASQTVTAGTPVTFTAAASGSPAPTYQWLKNGVNLTGATGTSYTIASVAAGDAGTYSVVASNSVGSATSNGALLTVTTAPIFTTQPASQTMTAGTPVTFTAAASGSPAPTYQWLKNGVNLTGATGTSYTIASVAAGDAGTYSVVASNSFGSATSNGALLTVSTPPVFTTQPASQTMTAGTPVTFTAAASGSPAPTYQWLKNGVNLTGATGTSYTIASVAAGDAGTYSVVASNSFGSATSNGALLTVSTPPVFTTQPASQTVTAGSLVTFTAAASGSPAPTYQWLKNGVNLTGATGTSYTIASVAAGDAGTYSVVASNSTGSATSNGALLTVSTPPVFTTQPASQTVTAGSLVTFTVAASGSPAPTYQWLKNGVNLTGATGTSYTIASVAAGDAGTYSVVASNSTGSATSNGALLTVSTAPIFTTQPASQTVTAGSLVTFTAAASGSPAPTYQWLKNGVNLTGATGTSYTIASVAAGDAGTYSVVASNSFGSATSNGALLTVGNSPVAPVFMIQPVSGTVYAGNWVTFTSAASGLPAPTYQWRKNGVNITGATGTTYTIASATLVDGGAYSVVASNTVGSAISNGASFVVANSPRASAPVFALQLTSRMVIVGSPVTFTDSANGSPAPTYQWRKNGVNITGATGPSYTIASAAVGDNGTYTVVATNSAGSVTSNGAVFAVRASAPPMDVRVDFNGDGQSDILWQNIVTGECSIWLMTGTNTASIVSLGAVPAGWLNSGTGDFNGDGQSDILWQNVVTGECSIWLMAGTNTGSIVSLGVVSAGWQISGTGDFNGDGNSDILWQNNATGERTIWLMSGTNVLSIVSLGVVSVDWQIVGAGDFNRDGQSDILWQNVVTGECCVWLMAGTNITGIVSFGAIPIAWQISGTGDFNGDGQSDILGQNIVTGECRVWLMAGTNISSIVSLGAVPTDWVIRN